MIWTGGGYPTHQHMFHCVRLPSVPASSAAARRVVERLAGDVDAETLSRLRLLVSELVTNVIEHVDGVESIELRVELARGRVHVEVHDGGAGFDVRPRQAGDALGSGWGLHFVEQLAEVWGTQRDQGTTVWFELPARTLAPAA